MDHIINSAAKTLYMSGGQMGCPIVFRGPNGAAARVAAQHSQDFAAWYMQVPGFARGDALFRGRCERPDEDGHPRSQSRDLPGKRNPLWRSFEVPTTEDFTIPFGKAKVERVGKDVTLVSFGIGVGHALAAADKLAEAGSAPR